jgi:hypothetical protein
MQPGEVRVEAPIDGEGRMGYQIKIIGNDLGDFHTFVLPATYQLSPGSTIDAKFADGRSGTFTVLKQTRKASWCMVWACAGAASDGLHFDLTAKSSVISPRPELADIIAEIRSTASRKEIDAEVEKPEHRRTGYGRID